VKVKKYVEDRNFQCFLGAAQRHGFVVDKNAPWRLIANLRHKCMQQKLGKDNIVFFPTVSYHADSSEQPSSFFNVYYDKTYLLDIDFMRRYMFQFYKTLIANSPFFKENKYCLRNRSTNSRLIYRSDIPDESIYGIRDYWLEKYFLIRVYETGNNFKPEEIKYIVRNAKSIYDIKGSQGALSYLNLRLKRKNTVDYASLTKIQETKGVGVKTRTARSFFAPTSPQPSIPQQAPTTTSTY
jgi:hypothetical protein